MIFSRNHKKPKIKIERYTSRNDSVENFTMIMRVMSIIIIFFTIVFICYLLLTTDQRPAYYKNYQVNSEKLR